MGWARLGHSSSLVLPKLTASGSSAGNVWAGLTSPTCLVVGGLKAGVLCVPPFCLSSRLAWVPSNYYFSVPGTSEVELDLLS